jgi:outer membrane protein insertion porin family
VLRMSSGQVFNGEAVEKSGDDLTVAITKSGYPFAVVRPQVERDAAANVINVAYVVEEGTRTYIERINVHGNEWTREYVIRREFDIGEGDAYNRNLIDRAERRLKRLRFFKTVKITAEPGSTPDRVVLDVAVEEDKTADLNFGVGYSTADGVLGEVSVSERNLLGTGMGAKVAFTVGQYVRGATIGFVEPYFLGSRASLGLDVFGKQTDVSNYQSYGSEIYGAAIKLSAPLTEEIGVEGRYSLYRQATTLAPNLMDCSPSNPPPGCYANGEASVPTKQAVLAGPAWVSMVGTTLSYSTLDNPFDPRSGVRADLKQDLAGLGGDVKFARLTDDVRFYQPITNDITGVARVQGGYIAPWGGQAVPLASSFFGGPNLVRGFAPNGFGPRDLTAGTSMDNVGGTRYWGTSAELQAPIPYLPPDFALKGAIFADAGSVFGYGGPALSSSFALADSRTIRSSIGAGLIWSSPFGPIRVDYAFPVTKTSYDVTQRLRFGAGPF